MGRCWKPRRQLRIVNISLWCSVQIVKATTRYETWLAKYTFIVRADLNLKHQRMAADPFSFLRATFYRWVQTWPTICERLTEAPRVLAVGDLHLENFGTWRDLEGRLIWGVNDFDEAFPLPYTNDLVRLATGVVLARETNRVAMHPADASDAILAGYAESLKARGKPFVLEEHHHWLRELALNALRDPVRFWKNIDMLRPVRQPIANSAIKALEALMPAHDLDYRVVRRVAGIGSLGRPRLVALAEWGGARLAREAKALLPSACVWQAGGSSARTYYSALIERAVRVPDPFVAVRRRWIVRRLAPDCSRIELTMLPKMRDEAKLLYAMGWETANVHLATKGVRKRILLDLRRRPRRWLDQAARQMADAIHRDWQAWRKTR